MLDERKAAILKAVIEEYTETAQPVGSTTAAAAAGLDVSAATVRNDMSALEADGFLRQPHTSAGRVPTQKGYRHFVDGIDAGQLVDGEAKQVASFFGQMRGEIEVVMAETAALLTNMTDHAAVVIDESDESAEIRSIQLVALADQTIMSVAVLANGNVVKQTIDFDAAVDEDTLTKSTTVLRAALEGQVLSSVPALASTGNKAVDALAEQFYLALTVSTSDAEKVYVDGTSKVVGAFDAVESITQVLSILEQQLVVVSLLSDVLERGLTVAIGTETGVDPLSECSLVVSPYKIDGERAGSIAVLGPTRMNYPQAMSAVAAVSGQLGDLLSES